MDIIIKFLPSLQIVLSILLIIVVFFQQSEESLGSSFGGSDSIDTVKKKRRGGEKFLFRAAITIAILFVIVSIASFSLK